MAAQDIRGSLAHAAMLHDVGVLSAGELTAIRDGLARVAEEIARGEFPWEIEREDVHMNIEARLTSLIGDAGKKLHTGRSRNDQVATDIRLFLRDAIDAVSAELTRLQRGIAELAAQHAHTVMPGFTHLQVAQPVDLRPSPPGLERDAGARLRTPDGLPPAHERVPPRRRGPGGHDLPHRPRGNGPGPGLRRGRRRTPWTACPIATSPSSSPPSRRCS
jgi:hypothetical protein